MCLILVNGDRRALTKSLRHRSGCGIFPENATSLALHEKADVITTGTHMGTHIDAPSHVSDCGRVYGGMSMEDVQRGGSLKSGDIASVPPIVARGVLLDIARLHDAQFLPAGYGVTARDLHDAAEAAALTLRPGDVVLIGTGWDHHFDDPDRFVGYSDGAPGPTEAAAQWLVDREVRAVGGETIAFEQIPPGRGHSHMPVHRLLLAEHGIPIIEVLKLGELRDLQATAFTFVATPLRLPGASGSPLRPLAILDVTE